MTAEAALREIVALSRSTPRRMLADGEAPNPTSVALTKAEEIATLALHQRHENAQSVTADDGIIVRLTAEGLDRVLDGKVGMTFLVDKFTDGVRGPVAHVRDYRYAGGPLGRDFQIWSIANGGYERIASVSAGHGQNDNR